MNDILETLQYYINIINEARQKFNIGDEVIVSTRGKSAIKGKISKVLDLDPIIGEYQYEIKEKNGKKEIYLESSIKKA